MSYNKPLYSMSTVNAGITILRCPSNLVKPRD